MTALASCGALLIAAEGPFIRFYHAKDTRYISSKRVFKTQAVHGLSAYSDEHDQVTKLVVWGGRLVRALEIELTIADHEHHVIKTCLSDVAKAPDWILDLAARPTSLEGESQYQKGTCVAVTAHNALLQVTTDHQNGDKDFKNRYRIKTLFVAIVC